MPPPTPTPPPNCTLLLSFGRRPNSIAQNFALGLASLGQKRPPLRRTPLRAEVGAEVGGPGLQVAREVDPALRAAPAERDAGWAGIPLPPFPLLAGPAEESSLCSPARSRPASGRSS